MDELLRWAARLGDAREDGQTMVEYTVVLAVITAAIVVSIALLSSTTNDMITNIIGFL